MKNRIFPGVFYDAAQLEHLPADDVVTSSEVSKVLPLQMMWPKAVVLEVLELSLAAMAYNRNAEELRGREAEIDLLIQQRTNFKAWVEAQPDEDVFLACYPGEEFA